MRRREPIAVCLFRAAISPKHLLGAHRAAGTACSGNSGCEGSSSLPSRGARSRAGHRPAERGDRKGRGFTLSVPGVQTMYLYFYRTHINFYFETSFYWESKSLVDRRELGSFLFSRLMPGSRRLARPRGQAVPRVPGAAPARSPSRSPGAVQCPLLGLCLLSSVRRAGQQARSPRLPQEPTFRGDWEAPTRFLTQIRKSYIQGCRRVTPHPSQGRVSL